MVDNRSPGFVTLTAAHANRGCQRPSGSGNLAPRGERPGPEFANDAVGDQMLLKVEVVVDSGMCDKKPLR